MCFFIRTDLESIASFGHQWIPLVSFVSGESYGGHTVAQHAANRKKTPANKKKDFLNLTSHTLQILTTQPKKKHLQIKKTTVVNLTTHTLQMLTTQLKKKRAAHQVYVWAFAVCFFICLCCDHLLSNWWKCFLDLLVLFLFACVFWSCSALSSLGHAP